MLNRERLFKIIQQHSFTIMMWKLGKIYN